jgi:uncharacterized membrane protein
VSVDVITEIAIDRSIDVVSRYAADPSNAPEWYVNIDSVEWKTSPPLAVGSKLAFVAHFLGRRLAYTYEIVEFVPGARLVMRTTEGPFPMETTYEWAPIGPDGTRMKLRNRGQPRGFSRLVAPMMEGAMRRANRKDLARLKELLESTDARSNEPTATL